MEGIVAAGEREEMVNLSSDAVFFIEVFYKLDGGAAFVGRFAGVSHDKVEVSEEAVIIGDSGGVFDMVGGVPPFYFF